MDTAPQLYMIVGLGIKLKSMSMRSYSWRWTSVPSTFASKSSYCREDAPQKKAKPELCPYVQCML